MQAFTAVTLLVLLYIGATVHAALPTCPPPSSEPTEIILYPNPADCTSFYECDNGELKLQDCPLGTHFNAVAKVCDHPWAANCKESSKKKEVILEQVEIYAAVPSCPPPSSEPGDIILYPNTANCSTYYECDNGVARLMECPNGLHFNPVAKVCDHPWAANCKENSKKKEVILEQVEIYAAVPSCPPPSSEPGDIILYPNTANCSTYYECDNGVAKLMECPNGLHFNPVAKVCDHPWAANCIESSKNEEVILEQVEIYAAVPSCPPPSSEPGDIILYPNTANCSTYYECDNGVARLMECPNGLHFNPVAKVCDHPWAANCKESSKKKEVILEQVEIYAAVPSCPPPSSEPGDIILYPNTANCSTYYECDNGVAKLMECPSGLHFNPVAKVCDHPWAANCKESSKKKEVILEKVEIYAAIPSCPPPSSEPGDIILYPNTANCSTYYECDNGVARLMECPNGLHFNPVAKVCDHPWAANCKESSKKKEVILEQVEIYAAVPSCPPPSSEPGDIILYPNTANCSTYYECDNGVARLMECPIGLHFNPVAKVCDHPWAANCKESSKKKEVILEQVEIYAAVPSCPPPSSEPGDIILYPNTANCSTYYECDNGVARLMECPNGLHFNPVAKVCDHPWAANCKESSKKKEVILEQVEIYAAVPSCPPPSSEPGDIILYPNTANCSTYYECDNGVAKLMECPSGLHFNPVAKVCDHPWAANCVESSKNEEVILEQVEIYAAVPSCPPPSSEPGDIILYPNTANCSTYYECDNGVARLMECPNGLHFNPVAKVCDHPWAANCKESSKKKEVILEQVEIYAAVPSCPPPSSEPGDIILYPNTANCSTYYECDNGVARLMECPNGLHFNPVAKVCDHPWAANCKESSKKTEIVYVRAEVPAELPTCPPVGDPNTNLTLFPNPDSCTSYYECDNGYPVLQECPLGTYFNPITLGCDHPWAVNCTDNSTKEEIVRPKIETYAAVPSCPPPSSEPGDIILYPNSANCSTYYECDNGIAKLMNCPDGLHFNAVAKVCDHPWSANCKESIIKFNNNKHGRRSKFYFL